MSLMEEHLEAVGEADVRELMLTRSSSYFRLVACLMISYGVHFLWW